MESNTQLTNNEEEMQTSSKKPKNIGIIVGSVLLVCALGFMGYKFFWGNSKTITNGDIAVTTTFGFSELEPQKSAEFDTFYIVKDADTGIGVASGIKSYEIKEDADLAKHAIYTVLLTDESDTNELTYILDNGLVAHVGSKTRGKNLIMMATGYDDKNRFDVVVMGPANQKDEMLKIAESVSYKGKPLSSYNKVTKGEIVAHAEDLMKQYQEKTQSE